MKKLFLGLILLINLSSLAQKPERVYSIVMERREETWYQEQEKLWKQEIDKNNKNANAWHNYYQAVRAQYLFVNENSLRISLDEKLEKIVNDCYKLIPDSFEANLMMYQQFGGLGKPEEYVKYLQKAYDINPLDARSYVMLLTYYYVKRDKVNYKQFCEKYYKANEIAGFIYNMGYNILIEADPNAIILTAGDNDTYPELILQEVLGIRTDVHVLNIYLLTLDDYRDKIFAEIGLPKFEPRLSDVKTMEEFDSLKTKMLKHILENKNGIPTYVCLTAVSQVENDFGDNLYLTGLNYKYATEAIDNISIIKRNVENRFRLDYLQEPYSFHIQNGKLAEINAVYLPAFVKLYVHYRDSEDWEGLNKLKPILLKIAQGTNQESEIKALIGE